MSDRLRPDGLIWLVDASVPRRFDQAALEVGFSCGTDRRTMLSRPDWLLPFCLVLPAASSMSITGQKNQRHTFRFSDNYTVRGAVVGLSLSQSLREAKAYTCPSDARGWPQFMENTIPDRSSERWSETFARASALNMKFVLRQTHKINES